MIAPQHTLADPVHSTVMELRPNVMRFALLATFALIPAAALAACGSSTTADVFSDRPGAGVAVVADGSVDGDGVDPDGGAAVTGDGSAIGDSGKPKDGGKRDSATVVDANVADVSVPADDGIFCGTDAFSKRLYCDPTAQACCVRSIANTLDFNCKNIGTSCAGLRVPCSDSVDCGGQACCATYDNQGGGGYTKVACAATCGASNGDFTEFRLCDPNAAIDECAAVGLTCLPSTAIDGWYVCKK